MTRVLSLVAAAAQMASEAKALPAEGLLDCPAVPGGHGGNRPRECLRDGAELMPPGLDSGLGQGVALKPSASQPEGALP